MHNTTKSATTFHQETPLRVRKILEQARVQGTVLRLFYGDQNGRDWGEENDVCGYVGRSTGSIRVPLLLEPLRDDDVLISAPGGAPILDHCIVRIVHALNGHELWRRRNYRVPILYIKSGKDTFDVERQEQDKPCEAIARFPTYEAAAGYQAFIQGFTARPDQWRTLREYRREIELEQEAEEA